MTMVTLMSDTLNSLNNIRTLRANARELDLAALEEMLEKLSVVVSERREEAQASEAANREKLRNWQSTVNYCCRKVSILTNC